MSNIDESIVLVGGGGGVYRIARFLKHIRPNITTIQTVFDHGGHSGSLRDERGILPPGDLRQAIVALSDDNLEPTLRKLLSHRFSEKNGSSLDKATVGNILLTALTETEGSLPLAINALSRLCNVKGKILPVSLDHAELCVTLNDGTVVCGENNIDNRSIHDDRVIEGAFIEPKARIFTEAREALLKADKIIFCPGDIYTSLIPNLIVEGFEDAISKTNAKLIYVANIMTKKSETHGFKASDFVKTLSQYIDGKTFDHVICNNGKISDKLKDEYSKEMAEVVEIDHEVHDHAKNIIEEDLIDETSGIVRHHEKIASIIADL